MKKTPEEIAEALATSRTKEEAARKLGVVRSTLHVWEKHGPRPNGRPPLVKGSPPCQCPDKCGKLAAPRQRTKVVVNGEVQIWARSCAQKAKKK